MASEIEPTLPFLRRPDLVIRKLNFGSRVQWTVKDPVSLRFFQLREEEYFILSRLNRDASVESIVAAFERVFAPTRLSLARLDAYLRFLLAQGLVVRRFGGGAELYARGKRMQRATRLASMTNPLVIRWRGINPRVLINCLYPLLRWCFSAGFVCFWVVLMCLAASSMVLHHEEFVLRMPTVSAFISLHNIAWIAVAIGVAKVLHELAHALACKHFGGECREMGVMLLVFAPCLYCNVSDAWLMNNRWHRIAISGAGIFMELILATIASFVWWFSEPGVLNSICMNMMIVCSINTVLFNGNPLLRYDGYYVLADLVEVPNLGSQARSRLLDVIVRLTCGVRFANPRALPARGDLLLIGFGAASFVYRCFVLILIFWALHELLRPMGLVAIAQLITAATILTFSYAGLRSLRILFLRLRTLPVNKLRLGVSVILLVMVFAAVLNLKIPRYVSAPVTIQPSDAVRVYVAEGGRIPRLTAQRTTDGQLVKQGDPLVVLENPDLEREILELRERIEVLRIRIATIEASELRDADANENLPASKELLESLEGQMQNYRERHAKLTLRAPVGGIVLTDERRRQALTPNRLQRWSGTPLENSNVGCTLDRGTTYCMVGDPKRVSATMVVDEAEIELVEVGQSVRVWLRESPGVVLTGRVQEISAAEIEQAPASLVNQDELTMIEDGSGLARMAEVAFNVRVPLGEVDAAIPIRSTGYARISVPPITIGQRIQRYLASTFRLTL